MSKILVEAHYKGNYCEIYEKDGKVTINVWREAPSPPKNSSETTYEMFPSSPIFTAQGATKAECYKQIDDFIFQGRIKIQSKRNK
ncbi:MAG: hypothetical protein ABIQ95_16335 [Bdellovibrionia bacterium]